MTRPALFDQLDATPVDWTVDVPSCNLTDEPPRCVNCRSYDIPDAAWHCNPDTGDYDCQTPT